MTVGHVVGQSREQRGPIPLLTRLYLLKQKQTKKSLFYCVRMCLSVCPHVHRVQSPEEGTGSPGAGIRGGCEPPDTVAGN